MRSILLPNGASGHVTLSLNSCDGLGDCKSAGGLEGLVVTGIGNLKDAAGNPLLQQILRLRPWSSRATRIFVGRLQTASHTSL